MNECEHRNVQARGKPYALICQDCGSEVFHRGYWGAEVGETVITEPRFSHSLVDGGPFDERTPEQRRREGVKPPWPTQAALRNRYRKD